MFNSILTVQFKHAFCLTMKDTCSVVDETDTELWPGDGQEVQSVFHVLIWDKVTRGGRGLNPSPGGVR